MEQQVFKKYEEISDKHLMLMKAFEHYEETHKGPETVDEASSEYRKLLLFWRTYLSVPSCPPNNGMTTPGSVNLKQRLEQIEKELTITYSPIELSKSKVEGIYTELVEVLSSRSDEAILCEKAVFLLCRLLYNIVLLEDCYFGIVSLPYIDFLNNLKNRLNICIIVSQLDYFSQYFEDIVSDFNDDFISVIEVTPHILSVVGNLNFKCHKYAEAIKVFEKAISSYERRDSSNLYTNNEYFVTKLLLAYCYEYNHKFEASIKELIGIKVSDLLPLCGKIRMYNLLDESSFIEGKKAAQQIVKNIIEASKNADNNNLLKLGLQRDGDLDNSKAIGDAHEVLHSLAHCLNELGIKNKNEGKVEHTSKLLYMARMIMLVVANQNSACEDFQTCLYMIYGEAKDYDVCLGRINAITKVLDSRPNKNVNYYMENTFYQFLVYHQSNKFFSFEPENAEENAADEAYKKFVKFAERRYDYDAVIHIEIMKFRSSIIEILRTEDEPKVLGRLKSLMEKPEGKSMFDIVPSAKLNKWIVQEYNKTIALYEFLVKYFESSGADINALYNYACRFSFFRNQFEQNVHTFSEDTPKEEAIEQTLKLIIDDVVSPQSIFILAPLTTAVPYQHQTRSLLTLEENLFLESGESPQLVEKLEDKLGKFLKLQGIPGPSQKAVEFSKWLFDRKKYQALFVISKNTSDQNCDRYYYRDYTGVSAERPIYNVQTINRAFSLISAKRTRRRHKPCANRQPKCCIAVIEKECPDIIPEKYTELVEIIKSICNELLLPINVYENAHFIVDYNLLHGDNSEWVIVGFKEELSKVLASEVVYQLCGKGVSAPKEYDLGISHKDYCYVYFEDLDARIATADLLALQSKGICFWFHQKPNDDEEKMLADAKHALFFMSPRTLENDEGHRILELIEYARNKPMDSTNINIIATGFNSMEALKRTLTAKNIDMSLVNNFILKSVVLRSSLINDDSHIQSIIQLLVSDGVGQNGLQSNG